MLIGACDPMSHEYVLPGSPPPPALYYAQVDAAVFISGVALAGLLPRERQERWAEPLLHQAFGNLRTTGLQGFRPSSTNQRAMRARGWRSYFNSSMAANCGRDCTVGMQSWMWFTYLWAGHHTGISLFGERVYEATHQEMALWYGTFRPNFHRFGCFEPDLRWHAQP